MPTRINLQNAEFTPNQRTRTIPQLHFDSSKSGIIRLFGTPAEVWMHYVDAGVPLPRLICPVSIETGSICHACRTIALGDTTLSRQRRFVSVGWDCIKDQWCYLMFTDVARSSIVNALKPHCDIADIATGGGADIILQRIGMTMDVSIMEETLHSKRGPKPPYSSGDELPPTIEVLLQQLKTRSAWRKCVNKEDISKRFSKYQGEDIPDEITQKVESIIEIPIDKVVKTVLRAPIGTDSWDFLE